MAEGISTSDKLLGASLSSGDGHGESIIVINCPCLVGKGQLPEIIYAHDPVPVGNGLSVLSQRGQNDQHNHPEDGTNNNEFDEGKGTVFFVLRFCFHIELMLVLGT